MKILNKVTKLIALSFIVTVTAQAADVSTTFTSGEVLTATKLNDLVTDINSNDDAGTGDITAVIGGSGITVTGGDTGDATVSVDTAAVQARVSGTCPTGQSIRVINSNGTVSCEVDTDTTYIGGAGITISGTTISKTAQTDYYNVTGGQFIPAFNTYAADWHAYDFSGNYGFPTSAGGKYVIHGVRVPNGATITEARCYYQDNNATYDISTHSLNLQRLTNGTALSGNMASASITATTGSSSTVLSMVDTTISNAVINNELYTYYLILYTNVTTGFTATTSSSIRFYGCRIAYTH